MRARDRRGAAALLALMALLVLAGCEAAPTPAPTIPSVPAADLLAALRRAPDVRTLPADLTPPLDATARDVGFDNTRCEAAPEATAIDPCVYGDRAAADRVVLYGDSRAGMWLPALSVIAERRHWRMQFYGKPGCPVPDLTVRHPQGAGPFTACNAFRAYVLARIRAERPALVIVATAGFGQKTPDGEPVAAAGWQAGYERTLTALAGSPVIVLGDIPVLAESGPDCLAHHSRNVPACATSRTEATARTWHAADRAAASSAGAAYVPVLPWLCAADCPAVIGRYGVYRNRFHLTATYVRVLTDVLDRSLGSALSPPAVGAAG